MQALGNLRIDVRIFGTASRDYAAQDSRRFRITRGEERHVVPPGHEPFGQQRRKELPRSVVARRHTPRNRCEYRYSHWAFNALDPGGELCSLWLLASPSLLRASP